MNTHSQNPDDKKNGICSPDRISPDCLTVEYLIVLANGESFCDRVETLNKLLQVDSAIIIKAGSISHLGEFSCGYKIAAGEVTGRGQRYFQLQFSATIDEKSPDADAAVDKFSALLKAVRTVVSKTGAQIETLWDGVSFFLSKRAYLIFYNIENTMRKLITNFMLITVGKEWVAETSPAEVRDAISKSKRKDSVNVLHSVDFIHLADFLTKPYSKVPLQDLYARIKTTKTPEEVRSLAADIPMSNWQRYFASIVRCEGGHIQKLWAELYDFRCKVAHNSIFTRNDYNRTCRLAEEVQPLLEEALQKLPQVTVPPEERETVAESAAAALSELIGDFISAWRLFEGGLLRKAAEFNCRTMSVSAATTALRRANAIDDPLERSIRDVSSFRNHLVHSTDMVFSEADVRNNIVLMLEFISTLNLLPSDAAT